MRIIQYWLGWWVVVDLLNHGRSWSSLGGSWSSVADPGELWATGRSVYLSGKPTLLGESWFDPNDLVSV